MIPPAFDDVQIWVQFRDFMKHTLKIKLIVKHWIFELVVSILIICTFINVIFLVYDVFTISKTLDDISVWIFVVELLFRIIGIGPENFFADRWNNLDSFLVILGMIFFFIPISDGVSSIARMARIFRIASLLRVISHSNYMNGVRFKFL